MPYIRVYLPKTSIEQKRSIARKLIEITLRTFHLRPEDRYSISVEFISMLRARHLGLPTADTTDFMLEVMGHDLREATKRAFAKEAGEMLNQFLYSKSKSPFARFLGIRLDPPPKIAFQFAELNPAISEPFVVHPAFRAA